MKIAIIAVGQKLPAWANAAVQDYLARLPRDFPVAMREIRPEPRQGQPIARLQSAEAERLRAAVPAGAHLIALDEKGKDWATADLAQALGQWRDHCLQPAFLIGGPDGLDPQLRKQAALCLRLSSMTLPHALARVVLVEQIYRAWSILHSHPYHRA